MHVPLIKVDFSVFHPSLLDAEHETTHIEETPLILR